MEAKLAYSYALKRRSGYDAESRLRSGFSVGYREIQEWGVWICQGKRWVFVDCWSQLCGLGL